MVAEGEVLAVEVDEEQGQDEEYENRDAGKDHDEEKVRLSWVDLFNFHRG